MTHILKEIVVNSASLTISALTGARQNLKSQLASEEEAYEKKIAPLKEAMLKIEGMIVDKMDAEQLDNVKTSYGTAYFTHPETMRVMDRENFFCWVLKNVDNGSFDVLTSAVSKDAVRARINNGLSAPYGVEITKIRKLCIRKASP